MYLGMKMYAGAVGDEWGADVAWVGLLYLHVYSYLGRGE